MLLVCGGNASGDSSSFEVETIGQKHHVTADRTLYHSKEKVYEAFGHVVVSSHGQRLSSDYLWVDTTTNDLKAKGNVVFVDRASTVQAAEIHYNLNTQLGSIFYGKVSNDSYTLKGQLIRKVGDERFLTTDGEYTTCRDCAESWKIAAKNVDFTIDGYAFMDSVFFKIKDVPTVYVPYLIIPVKNRRQTGLLFPRFGTSSRNGFTFMQPLFLAIDPHQDATIGFGKYSSKGLRYEFEYRYKTILDSEGWIRYNRTNDRNFTVGNQLRQSILSENDWPLHEHLRVKWRIYDVLDRDYPKEFPEDIVGEYAPNLESGVVASAPFNDFFISAELKRYRNLLYDSPVGFDGGIVQSEPSVYLGMKDHKIVGPLNFSFYGRYDRFKRKNGAFTDLNGNNLYDSSTENLREANRYILTPELSAPFSLFSILAVNPSFQYNENIYAFNLPTANQNLSATTTKYLLGRVEVSTVLDKIYPYDGEKVLKVKHQMSPFIVYSNIPWINSDDKHPFKTQLVRDGGLFDQYDIVPVTNATNFLRLPQGNSIQYGFTSRVVRRMRSIDETARAYPYDNVPRSPKKYPAPKNYKQEIELREEKKWDEVRPRYENYDEMWNLSVSQAYDFKEAKRVRGIADPNLNHKERAFSFLEAISNFHLDSRFSNSIDYRFYPRIVVPVAGQPDTMYSNKHYFASNATYTFESFKNLRGTRTFNRSVSVFFNNVSKPNLSRTVGGDIKWSFNDFFALNYVQEYDLLATDHKNAARSIRTIYSSPSECWQLIFNYTWKKTSGATINANLAINLTGSGFVGVNQMGQDSSKSGAGVFGSK